MAHSTAHTSAKADDVAIFYY